VSSFLETKDIPQGRPLPPEILAQTDPPTPESNEVCHVLPCSASMVKDRKRSSITFNKKSTRAFQRAINQGSTPPLTWGSPPFAQVDRLLFFTPIRQVAQASVGSCIVKVRCRNENFDQ